MSKAEKPVGRRRFLKLALAGGGAGALVLGGGSVDAARGVREARERLG